MGKVNTGTELLPSYTKWSNRLPVAQVEGSSDLTVKHNDRHYLLLKSSSLGFHGLKVILLSLHCPGTNGAR